MMMTSIPKELEELRVYSLLSDQLHYIDINGDKYACFAGHIIPYCMVGSFLIWAWTGSRVYNQLYRDSGMVEILQDLNRHDEHITNTPKEATWYLTKKLHKIMQTWEEHHFDAIFEQALV